MKIRVKNLGVLKQAEFSLGDFTIICGENNIGKTYATYALYGFLDSWRERLDYLEVSLIPDEVMSDLRKNGITRINPLEYIQEAEKILNAICIQYTSSLSHVFAAPKEKFKDTQFQASLDGNPLSGPIKPIPFKHRMGALNRQLFSLSIEEGSEELEVSLLMDMEKARTPPGFLERRIKVAISEIIFEIIFGPLFPNPFIVSAERTGAAIFRKELNFAYNRLLKEMRQTDDKIDLREKLYKSSQDYPSPVEKNVDFTRQLEDVAKQKSFLADKHPEVLERFADIIGGEYRVTRNDELYFIPRGKRIRLNMDESSSGVRSMLVIGFYLRHVAKRGDLLMVDEPELSLHPENQRRIARHHA